MEGGVALAIAAPLEARAASIPGVVGVPAQRVNVSGLPVPAP